MNGYLRLFIPIFGFAIFLVSTPAWAGEDPAKIIVTDDIIYRKPVDTINCRKNVYLVFTWNDLGDGIHKATAIWYNPDGEQENEYDLKFVSSTKRARNWISLSFLNEQQKRELLLADIHKVRLNGEWKAKVFLDGDFIAEKKFNVECE